MPLVICRACKSYAGKALNYIIEKDKAALITTNGLDENRSFAQQFIDTAALHGKGDTYNERKYYHIKISFEPKDNIENGGKLNVELAEKIANEYFQKKYGNHEYVLAVHNDKHHLHCHAVINAVSFESGKKIQHRNKDLADMKDQINDISEKYGVSRFDWKQAVKNKRQILKQEVANDPKELTQAEKYIQDRHGDDWTSNSWKETLRSKIDEAKTICTSRTDFQKYLFDNYGVEMPRNTNKTVSFKHPAVNETVRGVKLGADYTAESIDRALIQNHERGANHAELRFTEENTAGTADTGNNAGTTHEITVGHHISENEPIGSGADESGKRGIKANIGGLREKLQQIRGLDKQFNPSEQRRIDEANERTVQQAREKAERARIEAEYLENEQRNVEQSNNRHDDEYER